MIEPFKVVIPARYGSTRLPGKPLLQIAGKPMIAHVCERAKQACATEVVVATDDQRIVDAVAEMGIQVLMTRSDHQSGTERIAEVAQQCGWKESDIVVNLQGDEPLIPAEYIAAVATALAGQAQTGMATLAAKIEDREEIFNANAVKVVTNKLGQALYFSRAPIPWDRENFNRPEAAASDTIPYLRHIGLYAYRVGFLNRYVAWDASPLEVVESLEQLRVLWHGESIVVLTVAKTPPAGVDTQEDLLRVEKILLDAATL